MHSRSEMQGSFYGPNGCLFRRVVLRCAADVVGRRQDAPGANGLTPQEVADGWILLFDGQTTFGWRVEGDSKVADGWLRVGGTTVSKVRHDIRFRDFELHAEYAEVAGGEVQLLGRKVVPTAPAGTMVLSSAKNSVDLEIMAPAGASVKVRSLKLRPLGTKAIFDGKSLAGWHEHATKKTSKWTVEEGLLRMRNGPGDLQSDAQWADFVLQAEIKTHGKALNSGIFFRCIPGDYQNGYEAQVQNGYKDNDRTKPIDFGTGAIYRRVPARKVVSNDNEWFTMTVAAQGKQLATWVNGYPTVDWKDERPANNNPRNGSKEGKGALSLQGHDPTTDISFRNIRLGDL